MQYDPETHRRMHELHGEQAGATLEVAEAYADLRVEELRSTVLDLAERVAVLESATPPPPTPVTETAVVWHVGLLALIAILAAVVWSRRDADNPP
jgi:hypothetical protein